MSSSSSSPDPLSELANKLGESWPNIFRARDAARKHVGQLRTAVAELKPPSNTSVVAFGSLAREEWTSGSDVDWTLMIDGPSDMNHFEVVKDVADKLESRGYRKPGPTQVFGSMASSHPLVHHIGGEEDTNQNTTRRILLLLESVSLSDSTTHERVIRSILERYVLGDPPSTTRSVLHVPLFLLNDVVRYWRTIAVDYAAKKWQRSNLGWALRNIKLRMSRKLLYAKGLLACFLCDGGLSSRSIEKGADIGQTELISECFTLSRRTAIDLIAGASIRFDAIDAARDILSSYDHFLSVLDDDNKRDELDTLEFGNGGNALFKQERENSRKFQEGLERLFFASGNDKLTKLTKRYGVF